MRDKDLIVGKYYLVENHNFYFKFESNPTNPIENLILDYHIITNRYYIGGCLAKNFYDFKEVFIEDIIEYLPIEHPDKINYVRKQRIKNLLGI